MRQAGMPRVEDSLRCAICDLPLISRSGLPAIDSPCHRCGCAPWCLKRVAGSSVILSALPDRTPEDADVQLLADSLLRNKRLERVVVDLSQLNTVSSLLLARLLALNKCLQPRKSRLAVSGAAPIVREIFRRTHFDTLLDLLDSEPEEDTGPKMASRVLNAIVFLAP